ncbi:hypothetical protein, partial [Yersinia mollaretii]|uniref:hypothetical protein n=1 Tax=Yersinia mollaretii TaxID=33060 RepID=UPI0016438DD1
VVFFVFFFVFCGVFVVGFWCFGCGFCFFLWGGVLGGGVVLVCGGVFWGGGGVLGGGCFVCGGLCGGGCGFLGVRLWGFFFVGWGVGGLA